MADTLPSALLDEAFERIEETILPCIAMMLETLIDVSMTLGEGSAKAFSAEVETLSRELESLTRAVERSSAIQQVDERESAAA